ncbi:flagellar hook protein FlgE [Gemmobacter denitrificans]|uniref:Flagellar hook protein FlgE n=1 Tax=Gemmobacter denitrificans TaxID=3123040 RepID=A0ABU8BZW5_9RHOB
MTISSALNAGVAGLNANANRLATISDNIANSGTYGYKRASTEFEAMVLSSSGSSGVYTAGGVRANSARMIDERGGLVGTLNALDMAVSGRGMLPVTDMSSIDALMSNERLKMTTTGAFRMDENGILRTASGLVLLGWPADAQGNIPTIARDSVAGLSPVVINQNQQVGDPTTAIKLGVNLPATDTLAGSPGDPLPLSVEYFGNLGTSESLNMTFTPTVNATGQSNTWTMEITDSASGGTVVGEYTLVFDDTRATGGSLLSVTTVAGGAYDPLTGQIALTVAGGPISLEIGIPGERNGLTQLSDTYSPTGITKDGSPAGTLLGVEINEKGMLVAAYDSGFTRTLYQIPVVDVPNINGLIPMDNQTFAASQQSGSFFLWNAGEGPTGTIEGYAREGSTTDVAAELTSLIQTQRAYSSNAKVIQTVDEMLQETTNIKR